jgi:hypothetical protein
MDCRFSFLSSEQAASAEQYAHGLGYATVGALARVLVLRAMKQYPLSGRQKARAEESHGRGAELGSGVLPSSIAGNVAGG